jgi:hypothetical protein
MEKVADVLNKALFWDVDPEKLDWQKNRLLIIQRALVRGGMNDVKNIMRIYSRDDMIVVIKSCKDLDKVTHNFCINYFNIPKEEMNAPSEYY